MNTSTPTTDENRRDEGPPRGPLAAKVAPIAVVVATLACIGWAAWPALQPAREAEVFQLVLINTQTTTNTSLSNNTDNNNINDNNAPASTTKATNQPDPPTNTQPIQAPGWIEADPFAVACSSLTDGVIDRILVLEGDVVTEGQTVATLIADDARLALARAESSLQAASADVLRARAERDAAAADYEQAIEPQLRAAIAAAMVEEAAGELARHPKQVAGAEATLRQLEVELEQVIMSSQVRAATELEVVIATQRAEAQRQLVAALRAESAMLSARLNQAIAERTAANRRLELRIDDRRRLAAAEADLASAESRQTLAQAQRDEANLALQRTTIRSPITGVVQHRYVRPGDKVTLTSDDPHGAHILLLYNPRKLQARVDVPLADAAHLRVGQRTEITVEVLPDRVFTGTLTRITHQADIQRNTLQVKVALHDPSPILRPEMLARVRFLPHNSNDPSATSTHQQHSTPPTARTSPANNTSKPTASAAQNTARVPASAVQRAGQTSRGNSINNNTAQLLAVRDRRGDRGTLHAINATIIKDHGDSLTLAANFATGDLIVANPADFSPGQRVRTRRAEQIQPAPQSAASPINQTTIKFTTTTTNERAAI